MAVSPKTKQNVVTILAVEDSTTQLEALRFLLEESGFSVIVATNGKEGLAAAKANAIDLVISDIVMPEADGYALCRALRADETLRNLPVILLTSLADPRDVIQGLESGANNFICKPYDDSALLARIRNVLANQEIRKAASSEMGISIFFSGQRFFITADRLQILDLLLSTYENAVDRNTQLTHTRDELRILNEQLEARVAERTAALATEVAERELAQVREHHLNILLHTIRDINHLIVREHDPARLIEEACTLLVELHGYRAIWIALNDRSGSPSLVAQAGMRPEIFEVFREDFREGRNPSCWKEAREADKELALRYVHESCPECPLWENYDQEAGIIPLRHGTRELGTIGIYLPRGSRIDDDEKSLLLEIADDLGLALYGIESARRSAAYANIVENSHDAMALVDRAYVYEEVNPAYARFAGRDESAIVKHPVQDIVGEEFFLKTVKPNLDRCFKGEIVSVETMREVPNLGLRFIELQHTPCRVANGSVVSASLNIRDITERKQAEKLIKVQLEELQRWQDVMLNREDHVQELKREVNELCRRTGEVVRYPSQETSPTDSEAVE